MRLQQLRKETIEQHEKRLAYLDSHADILSPLLDRVEKLEPQRIDIDDGYLNLALTGDKHKLNAIFGLLRRHGFEPRDRPKAGQSHFSTFFYRPGNETAPTVWLTFSSTSCRRVKTGTRERMVVEDVYEVVCDEQELPP